MMSFADIFRPKWKNSNSAERVKAVSALKNIALLEKIFKEDVDLSVRNAACDALKSLKAEKLGVSAYLYDAVARLIPVHDNAVLENGPMHTHVHYNYGAAKDAYCSAIGISSPGRSDIIECFICKSCGKSVLNFDIKRSTSHYTIANCGKCHATYLYKAC